MADNLDEEILGKADEWQREKQKIERERIRLRHERWVAVGRFFKWAVLIVVLIGGIGAGIWGGVRCHAGCQAESARKAEGRERLNVLYETAWRDCVDALGRERCELLQETWLYKCGGPLGDATHHKVARCAEERIERRLKKLEEGTE